MIDPNNPPTEPRIKEDFFEDISARIEEIYGKIEGRRTYRHPPNTSKGLEERMDLLRIGISSTMHDLESTVREMEYLRTLLDD